MTVRVGAALVLLGLAAGCAPSALKGYVGASAVKFNGQVGLGSSSGVEGIKNDLNDALDLGSTDYFPYLRAEAGWEDHRLTASAFGYDQSGNGTLTSDFGDIPAGTGVTSKMDFFNVKAAWSYNLLDVAGWRLAPGILLETYWMEVNVEETGTPDFENVDTLVAVPMPFIQGEADLGIVAASLDVGVMSANLGDADGLYWDVEALLRVAPVPHLELFGGYRLGTIDSEGSATGRNFTADIQYSGFFFGGGVVF